MFPNVPGLVMRNLPVFKQFHETDKGLLIVHRNHFFSGFFVIGPQTCSHRRTAINVL